MKLADLAWLPKPVRDRAGELEQPQLEALIAGCRNRPGTIAREFGPGTLAEMIHSVAAATASDAHRRYAVEVRGLKRSPEQFSNSGAMRDEFRERYTNAEREAIQARDRALDQLRRPFAEIVEQDRASLHNLDAGRYERIRRDLANAVAAGPDALGPMMSNLEHEPLAEVRAAMHSVGVEVRRNHPTLADKLREQAEAMAPNEVHQARQMLAEIDSAKPEIDLPPPEPIDD